MINHLVRFFLYLHDFFAMFYFGISYATWVRRRIYPKQVQRCAQMSGAFGKEVDGLLTEGGLGDPVHRESSAKKQVYGKDVDFLREFWKDALCEYQPGRQHKCFENYRWSTDIKSPDVLG